jgi:uncharacterized membrane protein YdcZ (DUF606 family)
VTSQVVLLALVLGVVAGAVIPFQTAINYRLAGTPSHKHASCELGGDDTG